MFAATTTRDMDTLNFREHDFFSFPSLWKINQTLQEKTRNRKIFDCFNYLKMNF